MPVIDVHVTGKGSYADGRAFGRVGPYERIDGVLTFAVDPGHSANRDIVDLALAPRDDGGRVRFAADFTLVKPVDEALGNRRLMVDVVNRGRRRAISTFNLAVPSADGSDEIPEGDGFLFERGFTVASIGWQWDVIRNGKMMGLEAPIAPVRGKVLVELRPDTVQHTRLLANRVHKPLPAADLNDPDAVLYVRDWEDGPYTALPREAWSFSRETTDGVVPSAEHVYLAAGFQPGKIYHLVYTVEGSPVVGAGMLALRDAASFLRHPSDLNPVAGGFDRAYAYGVSQTGRLLRHLVHLGLNVDEDDRLVYEGLLPHVAGGRRGEYNQRFAQPSVQSTPGFGHTFPFADDEITDPLTGATDGLLRRARTNGIAPRIIYTNTSAEYWRGDGSLTHTSPLGDRDLPETNETRSYLFAGTQHVDARQLPAPDDPNVDGTRGRHPPNVVDYRPLLRAALVNLDRWVSDGTEPPASLHPRIDDGTAMTRAEALRGIPAVPGLALPDPERLWVLRETNLGPEADRGIAELPVSEGREYPCVVSAVDSDGNEIAGIRLPDLTAPVGTHTGWNPRHPETGAPEQIIPMVGSTFVLARTAAEREATGDPRKSLEERYLTRDAYLALVREQAERLATERYLLTEDVHVVVENCASNYDKAMSQTMGSRGG